MEEFNNVRSWASELQDNTREQAIRTASLPILAGPLALMPDAHLGVGATIGTVIPTTDALVPSAVGVDIGCGMAARRTDIDNINDIELNAWVGTMKLLVPAGLGKWHDKASGSAYEWMEVLPPSERLLGKNESHSAAVAKATQQLGTLGSGNHFVELALDEDDRIWILLHSGSRGAGNRLAQVHQNRAIELCPEAPEPALAWLTAGTEAFDNYVEDLRWAQAYAMENRRQLLDGTVRALSSIVGTFTWDEEINCHHNYAASETHEGRLLWITRKGAIRAGFGDRGLIPGSMGQRSYVVRGRGNPLSYESCSHGAGRRMSRGQAFRELTVESLEEKMAGRAWQLSDAGALLDEHPDAYKSIEQVMLDQEDLVLIDYELQAIANYKGVEERKR